MSFARSFDSPQALAVIGQLSGTVVLRTTPARSPLGPGTGTVCIVGEPTNDRGSESLYTMVNALRELTSSAEFDRLYGAITASIGTAANGYEGNLNVALALPGIRFARLIVIAPNLECGEVTFARSAGGSEYTIPAGTIVSDGGTPADEFLTLEDLTFAESGDAQTGTVRIRPRLSAQGSQLAEAIDTIVSALDASVTSVENEDATDDVNFDTAYAATIALTVGETGLAGDIDVLITRRHTEAIRTALISAANAAAAGKRGRMCVYSPQVGTVNATAVGTSGVGVGATGGRNKRLIYAYPGVRSIAPALGNTTPFDLTSDLFAAQMASLYRPVENIGQPTSEAPWLLGIESGLDVAANQTQYLAWKNLGIAAPQIVDGTPEICEDVTTVLTAPDSSIQDVRTKDYLALGLHLVGKPWAKKLATRRNKDTFAAEVNALLDGLVSSSIPELQEIEGYAVDDVTGNTPQTRAANIHVIKVFVRTLYSMNTILFVLEAGVNVDVSVSAA